MPKTKVPKAPEAPEAPKETKKERFEVMNVPKEYENVIVDHDKEDVISDKQMLCDIRNEIIKIKKAIV